MRPRRALVTNDDGIASEGLNHLARAAAGLGLDVVVAAPGENASGSSASLTAVEAGGHVVVERRQLPGLDGVPAFAVRAVPGFIALIATRGAFGPPPEVVLSGINLGHNTGHAILHSGTVGAAMTACTSGCPALAVSLGTGPVLHWETAAQVSRDVLAHLLESDEWAVLNLNVPNVTPDRFLGTRRGRLAAFGAVQTTISDVGEGFVKVAVADVRAELEAGTDAALVASGYASVTPLLPICESTTAELPWPALGGRAGVPASAEG